MASPHENVNIPVPVAITNRVVVRPKTTLKSHEVIRLSNLDRQCPTLMHLVFFYKPSNNSAYPSLNSVFTCLKSGLEETLSIWYPAAGRLSINPCEGKLNLWCNNEGAVLVEAVTQVKISELGDLSQYNQFFESLVYKPVFNGNFSEMPLIAAQVTRFGCGGYSIGIGTSHSLFDGPATFAFLRAWASNSAIMKDKGEATNNEQHKPVHERGMLLNCDGQGVRMRAAAIDHLYQLIQQAFADKNLATENAMIGDENLSHDEGCLNYVLKTFHLSGAMIDNLKSKVLGEKGGSFSYSSFEVVTAQLWKARTKALGVRKERVVCLQFAVDARNKMVPPLPKGFSGNAYVLACVALRAGELEELSHEAVIEKIKQAKYSVNSDYVIAYMRALDGPQGALPPLKELTLVSDWTRMPFHKVDFLPEEASYASPLVSPIPQVAYLVRNPTDPRGIDVRIGLLQEALNTFSHYFLKNAQKS